ncbi:thiamine pyrophosphate-dependent dehydrogenase E1 component subunit alpha [Natronoglycomyces albus]|uniref:2-oxoisovalerate dehydrogenase subunit alpha n=1 Tax=Natronoglycomyces albus TaxID=2811108 RepID=A0A895XQL8_9ACTN|nr:thiamine pyrophosphate-dependent dehydrogenase E1 component subunit alpha [Natronoglycomyces albus]QSB05445.1 thiamine pyrophosphate-dependent dehydrogenase E1 component subunit alpha [Natronoglycomyces albus]
MGTGEKTSPGPVKKTATRRRKTTPRKSATASDGLDYVQLLTPEGKRVKHPDFDISLSEDEFRALYRDLIIARRIDSEGVALQRQGQLGLWPSLLGQEAAQIGSAHALAEQDMVFPSYRELGVLWARGVDPVTPFALFRGVNMGPLDSVKEKFHMYTVVIPAQTMHATGYAMGIVKEGKLGTPDGEAVITYHGDGATAQGEFNEALIWAGVNAAPVVFFCQNNQYAISESNHHQFRVPVHKRAAGFGMPGHFVDGNDVLGTYAVTKHAIEAARSGEGPSIIEAYTYRMGAHTTADDPTRYRDKAEEEAWRAKDPISRYQTYLLNEKIIDQDYLEKLDSEVDTIALQLRERVINLPNPKPDAMFEGLYNDPHATVDQQRAQLAEYLASFEGSDA